MALAGGAGSKKNDTVWESGDYSEYMQMSNHLTLVNIWI